MVDSDVKQALKDKIHSQRGRNLITFCIFVVIATGLWFVMSLNDTTQREYPVRVVVADMPEGITYCNDDDIIIGNDGYLGTYTVVVKEKGIFHHSDNLSKSNPLIINFTDFYSSKDGALYLTSAKMEAALQNYLGDNVIIVTWKPSIVAFKIAPDKE